MRIALSVLTMGAPSAHTYYAGNLALVAARACRAEAPLEITAKRGHGRFPLRGSGQAVWSFSDGKRSHVRMMPESTINRILMSFRLEYLAARPVF